MKPHIRNTVAGRHLFAITGVLILFFAAGMVAQGARLLSQAGHLPVLGQSIWNGLTNKIICLLIFETTFDDGPIMKGHLQALTVSSTVLHGTVIALKGCDGAPPIMSLR